MIILRRAGRSGLFGYVKELVRKMVIIIMAGNFSNNTINN
jgi:hypothetical protein